MHDQLLRQLDERSDRVREHTAPHVNRNIALSTQACIEHCAEGGRDAIIIRLNELDREWDIDRALMMNFAVVGGAAYAAGLFRYSRSRLGRPRTGLLGFFGAQMAFLFLHAAVGWCPPVALWRRLGFRTRIEIEAERFALLRRLDGAAIPA
jgi:hypothetical protein